MTLFKLAFAEMKERKFNFFLSILAASLAASTFILAIALLKSTDLQTEQVVSEVIEKTEADMKKLENNIRKQMKGLGFNIYIFPEGQEMSEVYDKGFASKTMPEEYVTRLAESSIVTVNHLLPTLTQKVSWPEHKRTVILIGVRGEVPIAHRDPKKPLIDQVKPGEMVIGFELHNALGLKIGDKITFMKREFKVDKCHEERGTRDDITIWANLAEVQDILDAKGQINSILALGCNCSSIDGLAEKRAELNEILPGTRIIERGSKALARAEARKTAAVTVKNQVKIIKDQRHDLKNKRESLSSVLVPLVGIMALAGISLLTFLNVRERIVEIGLFLAIGINSSSVLALFLVKAVVVGLGGGLLGTVIAAVVIKAYGGLFGDHSIIQLVAAREIIIIFACMPVFSALAAWLPSFWASRHDPAEVLRNE